MKNICFISNLNPLHKPKGAEVQTLNWMKIFKGNGYKVSQIIQKKLIHNDDIPLSELICH